MREDGSIRSAAQNHGSWMGGNCGGGASKVGGTPSDSVPPFRSDASIHYPKTMSTKTFIGTIDSSSANNFTDLKGELIECWRVGLLLSEDKGIVFNVGKNDPAYEDVQRVDVGDKVQIISHSNIKNDGSVRWKLDDISRVE